jgi:hypothetical protein
MSGLAPTRPARKDRNERIIETTKLMQANRAAGMSFMDNEADAIAKGCDPNHVKGWVDLLTEQDAEERDKREAEREARPKVMLPGTDQTISDAGSQLGALLATTERFYNRRGTVTKVGTDATGSHVLEPVSPATLASQFETVANLIKGKDGTPKRAICSEHTARAIASAETFINELPEIKVVTDCPVLIEREGKLVEIAGFDLQSGILAGGCRTVDATPPEAKKLLFSILQDFRFNQPADRARALAAIVSPTLVFGGLMKGRAPVDLGEADKSQTGKGYRLKVTAAIYAQGVKTITQRKGGVGSLEESLQTAILRGNNFICIDNVRGKLDSPLFESLLTEETVEARSLHRTQEIDVTRTIFQITSNKAELTKDMANRTSCVKLLKQPESYHFNAYPEGDLLDHVRANQPLYLGAVFAVVRVWHEAGQPRTRETRHDFRGWAQTLDWICQHPLDTGPLLEGHRETQERMTNPVLNWLRDVALEVALSKQNDSWLRARDIVEIISDTETETPGLSEGHDLTNEKTRKSVLQATGRKLGQCFRSADLVLIDGIQIERQLTNEPATRKSLKAYRFSTAPMKHKPIGANLELDSANSVADNAKDTQNSVAPMAAPEVAPMNAPMKSFCAPNAPDTSRIDSIKTEKHIISKVMRPLGALGATGSPANAKELDQAELDWMSALP